MQNNVSQIGVSSGLAVDDTNALKGIALLLLLCHHLFYIQKGEYTDIYFANFGIIQEFGIACKVCVAIFVFLSGYGLVKKYNKSERVNFREFYTTRFVKLMMNFWLIWLLFVPIGIFFFGRTPAAVYQNHILLKGILDFLGLAFSFGYYGYNPTW